MCLIVTISCKGFQHKISFLIIRQFASTYVFLLDDFAGNDDNYSYLFLIISYLILIIIIEMLCKDRVEGYCPLQAIEDKRGYHGK
jgi:hypothetical protein